MLVVKMIAFFSTQHELEFLTQHTDFKKFTLIALTAEADGCAQEQNLSYFTVEDYYETKLTFSKGANNLSLIRKICDTLDQSFPSTGLFSTHDIFLFIKLLIDQLYLNHAFCKGILEKESPTKVILLNVPSLQKDVFVAHHNDLRLHFITAFFEKKGIPCEWLSFPSFHPLSSSLKPSFNIRSFLSSQKFKMINALYRFINFKKPALFMAQHYDFRSCIRLRKFYKIYWLRDLKIKIISPPRRDVVFNKEIEKNLEKLFTLDGFSTFSLIHPKLLHVVNNIRPHMEEKCQWLYKYFVKKKIKSIVSGSGQSAEILAALRAGTHAHIPRIWGQHGGFYGYGNFPLMEDLNQPYTHYLLYTHKIAELMIPPRPFFTVSDSKLLHLYHANRSI